MPGKYFKRLEHPYNLNNKWKEKWVSSSNFTGIFLMNIRNQICDTSIRLSRHSFQKDAIYFTFEKKSHNEKNSENGRDLFNISLPYQLIYCYKTRIIETTFSVWRFKKKTLIISNSTTYRSITQSSSTWLTQMVSSLTTTARARIGLRLAIRFKSTYLSGNNCITKAGTGFHRPPHF